MRSSVNNNKRNLMSAAYRKNPNGYDEATEIMMGEDIYEDEESSDGE